MFIGPKEIKNTEPSGEKTLGGIDIIKVTYVDGKIELISDIMYQKIVSEESCDLSELRDKRVQPVVEVILLIMREWGVKLGELGYISALLNKSLDFNKDSAIQELFSNWMPRPLSLDEVDLVTVDRILKSRKQTLDDVINNNE